MLKQQTLQYQVVTTIMKIIFLSIGKENDRFLKDIIEQFTKRINHYYFAGWKILPTLKTNAQLSTKELLAKEAILILGHVKKEDYLVALDEKGTLLNSNNLASWIQNRANESIKQIVFLIGGAYGLDDSVLKRANLIWSLSPLTFPHQLVRLILAEQIYRACTIIKNEKYHHG